MQIPADRLASHLKQGLGPLYIVHGGEPLLEQEAADAIRSAARKAGFGERSSFTASGPNVDWSQAIADTQAGSLFADKRIVELRIPSGKPGRTGGEALQQLARLAAGNDTTLVLVLLPALDRSSRNSAWFKALADAGISVQVSSIDRTQLPHWIAARLAAQGQRVAGGEEGRRTLQFFAERVEGNLLAAHQEIQKLGLLHPPGELSWDQVRESVLNVARYDAFQLAEAALAGQAARVQRMLDGLRAEGASPVQVHWALADNIRALKRVRDALDRGEPMPLALRQNRVWGVRERLFERLLPRLSSADATRLLRSAHAADGVVKGLRARGWPREPWQALHQLALQTCRAALASAAR